MMSMNHFDNEYPHRVSHVESLAAPLRTPGALPDGIPLSIGIIATHNPADVQCAAMTDHFVHKLSSIDAKTYGERVHIYETEVAKEAETARKMLESSAETYRKKAAETNNIDQLLVLDRLHHDAQTGLQSIHTRPLVALAQEKMANTLTEKFHAEQIALETQESAALAHEIQAKYRKLGRRGCIASYAVGVILAAGSVLGMNHLIVSAEKSTPAAEAPAYDTRDQMIGFFILPASAISGGYLLGSIGNDRFAQRRAKRMVRRAQKRTAKTA